MTRRMNLVKYSLFFLGLSFVANLATLLFVLNHDDSIAIASMNTTIVLTLIALCLFCVETGLSTKALRMHLSDAEIHN